MPTKTELKKNRKAWVTALKSGEYEQGIKWLERDDKLCCLGVLSKLAGCSRKQIGDGSVYYDGQPGLAPRAALEWVGLDNEEGWIESMQDSLVSMNDRGKTFEEIAEIIELAPKGLFKE